MKRIILFVLLLLLAAISAGAAYKIQLNDGTYIQADDKPVIKEGLAYFSKDGLFLYIPVSRVDLAKTDETNMVRESKEAPLVLQGLEAMPPAPVKPVFVDDSMLDVIRKRSRLANEGQFERPGLTESKPGPGLEGAAAPATSDASKTRADLQAQLSSLLDQRGNLQGQADQIQARLSDLQDRYNFSAQQNDRKSYQNQINSLNAQLADVKSHLATVSNDALSVQQTLASQPVIVESKPQPQEPPAPPAPKP
jgi:hypothetical protein